MMEDIYEENCYSITIARSLKKKSNLLIVFLSVLAKSSLSERYKPCKDC